MKKHNACISLVISLAVASALFSGCASGPRRPACDYLQRPVRVAIVPGVNKTDQPEGNVVIDKAWETSLTQLGYQVVSADRVVTYAAASGVSLADVAKTDTAKIGKDLNVDAILSTQILQWDNSYKVIASASTVAGISSLVDCSTGATIWKHHWVFQEQSGNNSGGGIAGLLVNAAVTATIHAVTDAPTRLAKQGVAFSASTVPLPGNAPPEAKPPL